jgi:hypothetical protein
MIRRTLTTLAAPIDCFASLTEQNLRVQTVLPLTIEPQTESAASEPSN